MSIDSSNDEDDRHLDDAIIISIRLRPPTDERPGGYLGATSSYPVQPGETWRRGGDLADGPADGVTLARIMADIAAVMAGHAKAYDYMIAWGAKQQGVTVAEAHRQQMIAVNMPDIGGANDEH